MLSRREHGVCIFCGQVQLQSSNETNQAGRLFTNEEMDIVLGYRHDLRPALKGGTGDKCCRKCRGRLTKLREERAFFQKCVHVGVGATHSLPCSSGVARPGFVGGPGIHV